MGFARGEGTHLQVDLLRCPVCDDMEQNMDYTVLIRKAPDGYYIASCPLIPEAHAQGKKYEECLANIKEVLVLCLEYRQERGEEIPREIDTQKVVVTL
jgi:predicted RNase H-like HicB family nuclease